MLTSSVAYDVLSTSRERILRNDQIILLYLIQKA